MAAETFFARWSRVKAKAEASAKAEPSEVAAPRPEVAALPAVAAADSAVMTPPESAPTIEQVAQLQADGDFRPFVARGVDEGVRRAAMKKLFSDPHFNVMDGLDIYIDDYSKPDPIPAAMLLALNHAKDLLDPLGTLAREHAKRGLLTAAELADAAATQEPPTELPTGLTEPAAPAETLEPEAPTANAAADDAATIDPANRQEDHEQPNQSM
ncbi:DUF3306 domain-containing protein [Pseudoduganella armeniaca]|uniref:DUF3306 domain-containing protein n=1 Tax=Pseudoduganella armeniaca TaxID=2072590 RepID=A0A2R4C9R1_9BURK|nr:DUF3306 domain-containing protein [Pseudoduganella armeniaca]AVR96379.1 DUF3306 domain-containing protein [Pseudoduganella armeniaca]